MVNDSINVLTGAIIGAAIEVHKELGPGLLENIYEECLCLEFSNRGLAFSRQKEIPIVYKGKPTECKYRVDLFVDDVVVVELKSCKRIETIHEAQAMTYMKILKAPVGLLINFNVVLLKDGITRLMLPNDDLIQASP
ncbi:MAG: GxxExxY protein [Pseudomonadota bacterium]